MTKYLSLLVLFFCSFAQLSALTDIKVLPEYHYLTIKDESEPETAQTKTNVAGFKIETATSLEGGSYMTASYSQTTEETPFGWTTESAGVGQMVQLSPRFTIAATTSYRRLTLYLPDTQKQRFKGMVYGMDSYYLFKDSLCLFLRGGMAQNKPSYKKEKEDDEEDSFKEYAPFGHIEMQSSLLSPLKFSIGGSYERLLKQENYTLSRYTAFLSFSLLF